MFNYLNDELICEEVNLLFFAKNNPTPFFCYSNKKLVENYHRLKDALLSHNAQILIHYAVKANDNLAIIKTMGNLGAGVDVTSAGEIFKSLQAGIVPNKIIFSGIGKTESELEYAISTGVKSINIESLDELKLLAGISIKRDCNVAVMFRLNLDVDAKSHDKISTSRKGDKFGISLDLLDQAISMIAGCNKLKLKGLAVHIGSQILDLEVYKAAYAKLFLIVARLNNEGLNLQEIDFGGGIGTSYANEITINLNEYCHIIADFCMKLNVSGVIEPGRYLIANAGVLITRVIYNKTSYGKEFLIVDAGMNNIMRPALYDAIHNIIPMQMTNCMQKKYEIVGPICESGDKLASNLSLPEVNSNDFLAIMDCGAYCSSMSSNYNARPSVAEYLVLGKEIKMIKRPQTFSDMIARDVL